MAEILRFFRGLSEKSRAVHGFVGMICQLLYGNRRKEHSDSHAAIPCMHPASFKGKLSVSVLSDQGKDR